MRCSFIPGLILSSGLLWMGCKSATVKSPAAPSKPAAVATDNSQASLSDTAIRIEPLSDRAMEERADALAHYATGISMELNDKNEQALSEFYESAIGNPGNETLVVELSQRFVDSKQTDKAFEILHKSAARGDATGLIFATLSRLYFQTGKTNQAVTAAETAIKRSPKLLAGYHALADIYSQSGKPEQGLKTLDLAARQSVTNTAYLIPLADLYASYAKLHPKDKDAIAPKAKSLLLRADKAHPVNPLLEQKLADDLNYFGESKRAAEIYQKLISSSDDDIDMDVWRDSLREKLANIYLFNNELKLAAEQLQAIVNDNPTKYPQAYYVLGSISYEQKNFAKAAEYFQQAILTSPDLEQAYYDLAGSQINLNQSAKALETLEKARAKFKESFVGEFFSAVAYNRTKNYPEALKHYTAAEVIGKTKDSKRLDSSFYFQVGACHERNHDYSDAVKYFEKALQITPDDPETLNYLGYMWADRGENLPKAKVMIERAVKLQPKNPAFLDSLGWVLFKLGDSKQGLTYIQKAIELSPEPDPSLYDHLGDIYKSLKQNDKAQEAWKKSLSIEANDEVKKKLDSTL